MTLRTTPLQFGYFFCLLMFVLLIIRGIKQQRTSDKLLGWIMFILATELQDYTFGFAGINYLWTELNGFPRSLSLLFGPLVYFYFSSQLNQAFRFTKKELVHFVPYFIYFLYSIAFFIQGPEVVIQQQDSTTDLVLSYLLDATLLLSYFYYFSKSLQLYRKYKNWSINQFSNTRFINFNWFRNFILSMIFWLSFRELMYIIDEVYDLPFYQDWWWNLGLVVVSIYIGLTGYAQIQTTRINFNPTVDVKKSNINEANSEIDKKTSAKHQSIAEKIAQLMENKQLFLNPDLNLTELSKHADASSSEISAAINQVFKKNFNDYINNLRIDTFIALFSEQDKSQYTMLSIAYDSGFNSKATFNRAFKKSKGISPKAFFEKLVR